MQTITMQGIAELAQVERAVVSVWRTRHGASVAQPFPEPASTDPLRFDAAAVADWLSSTGHGNNAEARAESALHSEAARRVFDDPDRASALLLLHHLLGEPLGGMDATDAILRAVEHQVGSIIDDATLRSGLGDDALCTAVDELAEAAYSGGRALDRLVDGFVAAGAPWAAEGLTSPAVDLFGGVLSDLYRASPKVIVPAGPGGLVLASAITCHLDEHERPTFAARPTTMERAADRAAWRRIAAHGYPVVEHRPEVDAEPGGQGRLHLLMWQGAPRPRDVATLIEELVLELHAADLLMAVGPAQLLTDRGGRRDRARLLTPAPGHVEPLRYVGRLPKGLSRFGGRRRLGLWILGGETSGWTVVGEHGDAWLDAAARSAIAADVAASVSSTADMYAHAFRSSSVRKTDRLVLQDELIAAPAPMTPTLPGGERLARIWGLRDELGRRSPDDALLVDVDLEAHDTPHRHTVSLAGAAPSLARDLPGARLAAELLGVPAPGSAHVLGPDELREPAILDRRAVDRLALEAAAPRARLTEPGDVVYVASGGPAALVDERGGRVVLAPARILRCRSDVEGERRLLPSVAAADIARQSGTDRHTWRLRTVPAEQADALASLTARTAAHRQHLLSELRTLDGLERELVGGIADGSLTVPLPPPTPSPTPKAAR